MDNEQLDFFAHDEDDPPPVVGQSDLHWYIHNRNAEEYARFLQLFGLYKGFVRFLRQFKLY